MSLRTLPHHRLCVRGPRPSRVAVYILGHSMIHHLPFHPYLLSFQISLQNLMSLMASQAHTWRTRSSSLALPHHTASRLQMVPQTSFPSSHTLPHILITPRVRRTRVWRSLDAVRSEETMPLAITIECETALLTWMRRRLPLPVANRRHLRRHSARRSHYAIHSQVSPFAMTAALEVSERTTIFGFLSGSLVFQNGLCLVCAIVSSLVIDD